MQGTVAAPEPAALEIGGFGREPGVVRVDLLDALVQAILDHHTGCKRPAEETQYGSDDEADDDLLHGAVRW